MDFALDATTQEYRERLTAFMDAHVYPNEREFSEQVDALPDRWAAG